MNNEECFKSTVEEYTEIYGSDGKMLTRLNGTHPVCGAEWEGQMPIRIDYVRVTTELTNRLVMEKGGRE